LSMVRGTERGSNPAAGACDRGAYPVRATEVRS